MTKSQYLTIKRVYLELLIVLGKAKNWEKVDGQKIEELEKSITEIFKQINYVEGDTKKYTGRRILPDIH